jgi:twitching motility two-component system response regulator PilH
MSSNARPGLFRRLFGATESFIERRRQPRKPTPQGVQALLIDDSTTVLAVLGKMLRQNGYLVSTALDAESGLQKARDDRPDVVFLDIVLPGMNGFAALRTLKRDPATRDIPVVMMSGNMQATEQFYAQRIGADDFLKKPFPRAELFAKLERLLKVPQPSPSSDPEESGPGVVDNSDSP